MLRIAHAAQQHSTMTSWWVTEGMISQGLLEKMLILPAAATAAESKLGRAEGKLRC